MKMVSAAKLRGDQDRLEKSETWFKSMQNVFPQDPEARKGTTEDGEVIEADEGGTELYIMTTSDRGLCGGVNSMVSKLVKAEIDDNNKGVADAPVFIIGDKGRPVMARTHGDHIACTVDECWKAPMNFSVAGSIALRALAAAENSDASTVSITYNRFKSAISYDTTRFFMTNFSVGGDSLTSAEAQAEGGDAEERVPPYLRDYEMEPESKAEALQNLFEFSLAGSIYGACIENAASEQSSRMSAMDNASKNAGEMIESLTLQYNRARQAKITTELIEIISGAESLKG